MGCSTSSTNAVRNLEETGEAANGAVETVTGEHKDRKTSLKSNKTITNGGQTTVDGDKMSLSSTSSSNSSLDYPEIDEGDKTKTVNATIQNDKMSDEEVDIDLNDPEVGKAAVKIQAGFKNFMASKKKVPEKKLEEIEKEIDEELADIDLNDPEVEKAATKIQATFRGYKTRKDPQIQAK